MSEKVDIRNYISNVINEPVNYKFEPSYDMEGEFEQIKALTLEGIPYGDKKTKIFAYFGLPARKSNEKVPAIVLIHGGAGHAYGCWVKMWNDLGFAAIAVDTTGFMPFKRNAGSFEGRADNECWKRELGDFEEEGFTVGPDNDGMGEIEKPLEEQWMLHALSAAIKANNFLRGCPEIDNSNIGVTGISWGGVITSILIGYDTRFKFAIPVYGGGHIGDGMGSISGCFRRPHSKKLWLAEDNFEKVKIPVLWLCWNDDSPFSIQSMNLSFKDTVKNNIHTSLIFKNKMMHSHHDGWAPKEIYKFALSVVGKSSFLPCVIAQPKGRNFSFKVDHHNDISITNATAYYITSPMEYSRFDKHGCGERLYMTESWKTVPCNIDNDIISGNLPDECTEYYIEITFNNENEKMIVCTEFIKCEE